MIAGLASRSAEAPVTALGVVVLAGLALRLVWAALLPVEPTSDPAAYHILATTLVEHGVYGWGPDEPSAYWAVGAPALYALGYLVLPPDTAVVALNLAVALGSMLALYELGRRWLDVRAGLLAAGAFALWPLGIQFTTVLSSEMPFILFTLAGLLCWERARTAGDGALAGGALLALLGAGLLWAAAVYIRPVGLLTPIVLAVAETLRGDARPLAALRRAALVLGVVVVCVAPWTARNYAVFDAFVPVSTNFGANFWMGNGAGTEGEYRPLPDDVKGLPEPERSSILLHRALDDIAAEPGAFVTRTALKALALHERETIGVAWNPSLPALIGETGTLLLKAVSTLYWYVLLAGGLVGAVYLALRRGPVATLFSTPLIVWAYYTGVYAVTVVGDRYHVPSVPFIALLGAVALVTWHDRRNG
ncbi:MAG: glycosyltransferase family 39 protein [Paracoccaceae bacterium]